MKPSLAVLAVLLQTAGCNSSAVPAGNLPAAAAGDVFTDPAAFRGRTVRVEGVFQGYNGRACRFASDARAVSLTRSDWLVRRGESCLYVTGSVPSGLDPFDTVTIGRPVVLSAVVVADTEGRLLLRPAEAQPR
jgi:hypothetical protein